MNYYEEFEIDLNFLKKNSSDPSNLFVASDLLKIETDWSNGIWLYLVMY